MGVEILPEIKSSRLKISVDAEWIQHYNQHCKMQQTMIHRFTKQNEKKC